MAQLAWAAENSGCISAEWQDSPNGCSGYDTKQSDDEAPVMTELREMRSAPLLPSFPGPLWSGVVASDRVLFMGQI